MALEWASDFATGRVQKALDEFLGFLTERFMGHTIYEDQKFFKFI